MPARRSFGGQEGQKTIQLKFIKGWNTLSVGGCNIFCCYRLFISALNNSTLRN
jgi:hypothetical protein